MLVITTTTLTVTSLETQRDFADHRAYDHVSTAKIKSKTPEGPQKQIRSSW